jgi:transcriptional regulator with XRE-family HTH domain
MPRPSNRSSGSKAPSPGKGTRRSRRPTVAGLGDEVGAAELGRRVAESLRILRQERHLSLDQLAGASGVSRAALSQIESARTNPTLTILWKVAVGLGVPFQTLLNTNKSDKTRLLRAADMVPLRSTDGRVESRLISPAGTADRVEIYELRFQPKGVLRSEPHGPQSTETVFVLMGVLRVTVGDEIHQLSAGDSLFFQADVRHLYENPTTRETRCLDVIGYGHG